MGIFFFKLLCHPWGREGIQFQWFQWLMGSGSFVWPHDMRGQPLLSHPLWSLRVRWARALCLCSVLGRDLCLLSPLLFSLLSSWIHPIATKSRCDCYEQNAAWLTLLIILATFLQFSSSLRKQSKTISFPFAYSNLGKEKDVKFSSLFVMYLTSSIGSSSFFFLIETGRVWKCYIVQQRQF